MVGHCRPASSFAGSHRVRTTEHRWSPDRAHRGPSARPRSGRRCAPTRGSHRDRRTVRPPSRRSSASPDPVEAPRRRDRAADRAAFEHHFGFHRRPAAAVPKAPADHAFNSRAVHRLGSAFPSASITIAAYQSLRRLASPSRWVEEEVAGDVPNGRFVLLRGDVLDRRLPVDSGPGAGLAGVLPHGARAVSAVPTTRL